MKRKWKTSENW